ncbi:MAG: DNA replication/repair protein RecF [Candidatus Pacebacteria bacterium]|jgi:DNA replication and repair protein RecF|nr:DNA replication/repair protein RecF [Candidatus Paceibacterota bacterium]MBT4652593.1 DNA replication/repair protein RecF [Candidatus Paceibacterota bacterium]MBT6756420.1 DNA replication/repair protein RecF [Candidatus Paceibacterota bacterium]MBT6921286.1 DNA replication/repair protein RecF [Candidatus Paceibacterota bacterium]
MKIIESILFQDFRIFSQKKFSFSERTLLSGKNGVGKTSIIEGINLLSHGDSFRASVIEEMISFDKELGRVGGKVSGDILEVTLTRGILQGKRTLKRHFSLNGAKKRKKNFVGQFFSVVFRPEDMRLIEGSRGRRRSFIDSILSTTDPSYAQSLHMYDQALKRINKFLEFVREGTQPRSVLKYWEMMLVKHGIYLQEKRQLFFSFLRTVDFPFDFNVKYVISEINQEEVDSHRDRAIAAGHFLKGPHKDDFQVLFASDKLKNRDVSAFGSRGQQRLGVLWLKLGELQFVEKAQDQKPLFLLDDIFSELDEEAQNMVLELVGKYQTIITTANEETEEFLKKKVKGLAVISL